MPVHQRLGVVDLKEKKKLPVHQRLGPIYLKAKKKTGISGALASRLGEVSSRREQDSLKELHHLLGNTFVERKPQKIHQQVLNSDLQKEIAEIQGLEDACPRAGRGVEDFEMLHQPTCYTLSQRFSSKLDFKIQREIFDVQGRVKNRQRGRGIDNFSMVPHVAKPKIILQEDAPSKNRHADTISELFTSLRV